MLLRLMYKRILLTFQVLCAHHAQDIFAIEPSQLHCCWPCKPTKARVRDIVFIDSLNREFSSLMDFGPY